MEGDCQLDPPAEPPQTAAAAAIERAEVAMSAFCMALASVGLLVNAAVLCALLCGSGDKDGGDDGSLRSRRRSRRHRAPWLRTLLGSLCVADVLLAASTLAQLSFAEHNRRAEHAAHLSAGADGEVAARRRARDEYCAVEALRYIWDLATTANLLTLVAIAAHLFAAARWPLSYGRGRGCGGASSRRRCCLRRPAPAAATTLAVIWLISAAGALLPAALVATSVRHELLDQWSSKASSAFCYQLILYAQTNDSYVAGSDGGGGDGSGRYKYDFGQLSHERVHLLFGLTLTATALLAIVGCYAYVLRAVRGSRGAGGDAAARAVQSSPSARHSGSASGGGSWRRLAVVAAAVTLLFLACYLPLYTMHTLASFYDWRVDVGEHGGLVYATLMATVSLAPIVDPLLYALRVSEIRATLASVFLPRRLRRRLRGKLAAVADETVGSFVALDRARDDGGSESPVSGGVSAATAEHCQL